MSISYAKLRKMLTNKKINKTQLHEATHINTNVVAKMSKNEAVFMDILSKNVLFWNVILET